MTTTEARPRTTVPVISVKPSPSDPTVILATIACPFCEGTHRHRLDQWDGEHIERQCNRGDRCHYLDWYCITDPDHLIP